MRFFKLLFVFISCTLYISCTLRGHVHMPWYMCLRYMPWCMCVKYMPCDVCRTQAKVPWCVGQTTGFSRLQSVLSFHRVGPGHGTQVVRLGSKCLSMLSYLTHQTNKHIFCLFVLVTYSNMFFINYTRTKDLSTMSQNTVASFLIL